MTSDIDASRTEAAGRPLVVASEPELLDELLRLCSAAGTSPVVAADPTALRMAWPVASVVLLATHLGQSAAKLPRRAGVVVVGTAADPLWELATDVGASHVAMLPSAADWLVGLLVDNEPANAHAPVLCVIGGQGGAGATTLAAGLARTSCRARDLHAARRPGFVRRRDRPRARDGVSRRRAVAAAGGRAGESRGHDGAASRPGLPTRTRAGP